jgi:citrate synthase
MPTPTASGLDGIVVAETLLSHVDGEKGQLVLAGHDVEALAGHRTFEEVCGLLWSAPTPNLGPARARAFELLPRTGDATAHADGMDALRAAVAHLPASTDPAQANAELTGAVGTYAAAWARRRAGAEPVPPDPSLGHAADVLRMLTGRMPEAGDARALDTYLVTVADHGMNASTFTARVVASTGSDLVSAVVAAIGALKGPLHGGAPGPVLDMLDAIGRPENAVAWLEEQLAARARIMGMGHRIYRVRDPRAAVLEKAAALLSGRRLELARAVETAATDVLKKRHPDRPLLANVEFYTAVLLDAIGVPRNAFTPLFAAGRAAGWCAHVDEQRRAGKLIRPQSKYLGAMP